jgi:putative holliday junction resolvase
VRVLAIDHGTARCGCAISDPTGTLVRPLGVIEPTAVEPIAKLARSEGAERVIVGLPVSLGGEEGSQAEIVREFCSELAGAVDLPVETFDERLTTTLAAGSRRGGAKAPEDALAAAHLLESYLQSTPQDDDD